MSEEWNILQEESIGITQQSSALDCQSSTLDHQSSIFDYQSSIPDNNSNIKVENPNDVESIKSLGSSTFSQPSSSSSSSPPPSDHHNMHDHNINVDELVGALKTAAIKSALECLDRIDYILKFGRRGIRCLRHKLANNILD